MRPDSLALQVADDAAGSAAAATLDERRVIAVGHEADLVAVRLVGDGKAKLARVLPNGVLVECADGKAGVGELRLRQA